MNKLEETPTREQLKKLVGELSRQFMVDLVEHMKAAAPAIHQMLVTEIGPALKEVMRDDVAPGLASLMTSPELKAASSNAMRELTHQAVLGSNDALAELADKRRREGVGGPLGSVDQLFEGRVWLAMLFAVAAVLAFPSLWFLRELTKIRRALEGGTTQAAREMKRALRSREREAARHRGDQGSPPRYA